MYLNKYKMSTCLFKFFVFILFISLNFIVCISDNHMWHSYQFGSGHSNREELVVSNITTDENFNSGSDVYAWKSISIGSCIYAVGLMPSGVTILLATVGENKNLFQTNTEVTAVNGAPKEFVLFTQWNGELEKREVIVVLVTVYENGSELQWFRIGQDNKLEKLYVWPLYKSVTHLNYFKSDHNHILVILHDEVNYTSADIYEFNFDRQTVQDIWFVHSMKLTAGVSSSAINAYGLNTFLSLPQKKSKMVSVYKLTKGKFIPYQNITSDFVNYVTPFKIGFKSYLAINGRNSGVYQFTKNGIVRDILKDSHSKEITYWLPVPIKTYRDEVLLLTQKSLYHLSHLSFLIEVVTYNGGKFVIHEEIPCNFYGEVEHGLGCLMEEDTPYGLRGSTYLAFRGILGILVPRQSGASGLFMVNVAMDSIASPVEKQMDKLINTRKILQKKMDGQKLTISKIKNRVKNAVKPGEENEITAPWNIKKLSAPAVRESNPLLTAAAQTLDPETNVEELEEKIDILTERFKALKTKLGDALNPKPLKHVFKDLTIDGLLEVLGDTHVEHVETEQFNGKSVEDAFGDIVSRDNISYIASEKTFSHLVTQNLTFQKVNGIDASELIFRNQGPITIKGNVSFTQPVNVTGSAMSKSGKVNGFILKDEIVEMGIPYNDSLKFENVKIIGNLNTKETNNLLLPREYLSSVNDLPDTTSKDDLHFDTIYIPANITVKNVNGINFDDFAKSLCMRNLETYIPGNITIKGDLIIEQNAEIEFLNDLKFPENYVFNDPGSFTVITGEKIFTNKIVANEVTTSGKIDGVDPDTIITLSQNQTLPEKFAFEDLEVSESLNVDGQVTGPHIKDFLKNPTLSETNLVKSNINFKILEVEGTITILNNFNGSNYESILGSVLYNDVDGQVITFSKQFPNGFNVINGLNLTKNSINRIPLHEFVTKDTEQVLKLQVLNGNVNIDNMDISGFYGNVNVTKLDQESVKLNGEQFISSTLIFENQNDTFVDISATELEILHTLNNLTEHDFFYTTGNLNFGEVEIENMKAESVKIEGNFTGNIANFDLFTFDSRRLSKTKDQNISAHYSIKNGVINMLNPKFINDVEYDKLFGFEHYANTMAQKLQEGKLSFKDLRVNGSIFIGMLNGYDMNEITNNCIVMNDGKAIDTPLVFLGDVYMNHLTVELFNEVAFSSFIKNIVFKNETNLVLDSYKTFENGFTVNHFLNTERLNGIYIDNILVKSGMQEISGPLNIYGDVYIERDAQILGDVNNVSLEFLANTVSVIDDKYIINDDVMFTRLAYINKLYVGVSINDITEPSDFLQHIVYTSRENSIILNNITFASTVNIEGELVITETINNVDLSEFVDDMVLITADDFIDGLVVFTEPVTIQNKLLIEEDLNTRYLLGIDLQYWKDNITYIDRGLIPGNVTFQNVTLDGDLITNYVNNLDLNTLIPLRSEQYIHAKLEFGELLSFQDINVKNFVNGYKLKDEYYNTVMTGIDQEIFSSIVFNGNVLVRENLEIVGLVNGFNLSKLVTTNTDQELTASYNFSGKTFLDADLLVTGFINGINVTDWSLRSVKRFSDYPQTISDKWVVNGTITFAEDVVGKGLLGGINIPEMRAEIEEKQRLTYSKEKEIIDDYRTMCHNVESTLDAASNQIYLFKYLENMQSIEMQDHIKNVHSFMHKNTHYLLVSEIDSCISHLLIFSTGTFMPITAIETGHVTQCISVYDEELVFIVTRDNGTVSSCKVEGTNVWKFSEEHESLIALYKIDQQVLLQDSLIPGTFYGMDKQSVTEWRLVTDIETQISKYRKWNIHTENMAFIPRGISTGLAVRNGRKVLKLLREDPIIDEDFGYATEVHIIGNYTEEVNFFLPGRSGGDVLVMNVGVPARKRTLVAVASHEETTVKGRLDFIKIYENALTGKVFHKVPTYKPSSLISVEFEDSGETLLMFMEDETALQIYEYKGIEGFKHKSSAHIEGSKLMSLSLHSQTHKTEDKLVILVNQNSLNVMETVMTGNRLRIRELYCDL